MRSITRTFLGCVLAQVHASLGGWADNLLFDRALRMPSFDRPDLDSTFFGKPGHVAAHLGTGLGRALPSLPQPFFAHGDSVSLWPTSKMRAEQGVSAGYIDDDWDEDLEDDLLDDMPTPTRRPKKRKEQPAELVKGVADEGSMSKNIVVLEKKVTELEAVCKYKKINMNTFRNRPKLRGPVKTWKREYGNKKYIYDNQHMEHLIEYVGDMERVIKETGLTSNPDKLKNVLKIKAPRFARRMMTTPYPTIQ